MPARRLGPVQTLPMKKRMVAARAGSARVVTVAEKACARPGGGEDEEEDDLSPPSVLQFPATQFDTGGAGDATAVASAMGQQAGGGKRARADVERCGGAAGPSDAAGGRPAPAAKRAKATAPATGAMQRRAAGPGARGSSLRGLLRVWLAGLSAYDTEGARALSEGSDEVFVDLALRIYTRFMMAKHAASSVAGICGATVHRGDLAACLWIAMKLEEEQTYVPTSREVSDVVGIRDYATLRRKEEEIGNALQWRLMTDHLAALSSGAAGADAGAPAGPRGRAAGHKYALMVLTPPPVDAGVAVA